MSLADAAKALFSKADKEVAPAIEHGTLSSSRLWIVLGFVILAILAKSVLTDTVFGYVFWLGLAYMIVNSITKGLGMVLNYKLASQHQTLRYADGKLDDNELKDEASKIE